MYVLNAEISIAGKTFRRVAGVEITSSAKVLEDSALIMLPASARMVRAGEFISEVETAKAFAVGDKVVIKLGYNGQLRTEFEGYISKIKPGLPVEVECLDAVFLLRRKNLLKGFKNTNLRALLEYVLQGTGVTLAGEIPGINFKTFYFKNISAAGALQKLKDEYGLSMYLKGTQLHVGLKSFTDNVVVRYELGTNVIDNDLEYKNEDDTRIKVKAVHIRRNNTKIEKEFGDADGELRTLYFYDLDNEATLKQLAEAEARKLKYTGYEGSLNAFLLPVCEVGNVVALSDPLYSERAGNYLVEKVVTKFGTQGARREVSLGIKL